MDVDIKNINILYDKARVLRESGKYREALGLYGKILQIDAEGNIENILGMGWGMQQLKKYREAIQIYDVILKIPSPREGATEYFYDIALYNKGVALLDLGRHQDAIIVFNKVIEADGDDRARVKSMARYYKSEALKLLEKQEEKPY